jgi:predicted HAD superfamily phosphohydrolase YqeG
VCCECPKQACAGRVPDCGTFVPTRPMPPRRPHDRRSLETMRIAYQRHANPDAVIHSMRDLAPRTLVVDIEPFIAAWDTGQSSLSRGIAWFLDQISAAPHLTTVCFATNSRRRPPDAIIRRQGISYLASACKPLRTVPYRDLPRPGVVIGDQIATDGVLAWRLGYSFIHYCPNSCAPLGPKLMRFLGYPVRPILFKTGGHYISAAGQPPSDQARGRS